MTKRDWNKEWDMEEQQVEELLASLAEFNACDHDWVQATDEDSVLGLDQTCTKCGGGRSFLSADEWDQMHNTPDVEVEE